jgi:hypothetical protein
MLLGPRRRRTRCVFGGVAATLHIREREGGTARVEDAKYWAVQEERPSRSTGSFPEAASRQSASNAPPLTPSGHYSGLMPANFTTLRHFSVSSTMR